jgi:chromosomal replication initiation ATPase DnaA
MNPSTLPNAIIAALSVRGLLELVDAVCGHRGVTRDELCGRSKSRAVAAARHELWWLMRHYPERCYSYSEIARMVCRDHATVLHGVTTHGRLRAAQPQHLHPLR